MATDLGLRFIGAFTALWALGMQNNVYAQIGLVILIGMAVKNAILIVEFAKLARERGTPLLEAGAGRRVPAIAPDHHCRHSAVREQ